MTNARTTRRALLTSIMSLILCCTMLLGTTFAWFTDTVKSANNTIIAGKLDVELYHADKGTNEADEKVGAYTTLFDDVSPDLWEPGAMAWEKFTIKNEGTLALKYQFTLNALNATVVENISFAKMLRVAVVDENFEYTREKVLAIPATEWKDLVTFTREGSLEANAQNTFGVVIWWQPSVNDNLFNLNNDNNEIVKIDVGVNLFATQMTVEEDSFDNQYDAGTWAGSVDTKWYDNDPNATEFTLEKPEELAGFAQIVNSGVDTFKDKTVKLGTDFDLNDISWTPIGSSADGWNSKFNGTFDGNGHTISNLYVVGTKGLGLFGYVGNAAHIEDVIIDGAHISGHDYIGAVVGTGYLSANCVKNCTVMNAEIIATPYLLADGVTYDGGAKAGAIAGLLYNGNISGNKAINCSISAYRDIGGIVGMIASESRDITASNNTVENVTLAYTAVPNGKYDSNTPNQKMGDVVGRIGDHASVANDNTISNVTYKTVVSYTMDNIQYTKDVQPDDVTLTLNLVNPEYTGETLSVPEGVTHIGNYAFAYNENVKTVELPDTVIDLGRGFDGSAVEKVVLNEGLTTISSRAFRRTTALEEVVISSTVKTIADNAFQYSAIKNIVFPENVTYIGDSCFTAATIETVVIEGSNVEIAHYAFRDCPNLTMVTILSDSITLGDGMIFTNSQNNNQNPNNITIYVKNEAVKNTIEENGTFKGKIVLMQEAKDDETIADSFTDGADTIYLPAGTYTFPSAKLSAGDTLICAEGTVFDGKTGLNINGATVIGATFTNDNDYLVNQSTINGTFKDCVFTDCDGLRSCIAGETVVFENCVFDTDFYGVHFDSGANDVVFKNCAFTGFNTFGSALTKLTLEDCTFKYNGKGGYNGINMWGDTDMINCTFVFDGSASTEWVDLVYNNKTVTFTNCVVTDGVTEKGIETVVGNYGTGNTIVIDGTYRADNNDMLKAAVAAGATKVLLMDGEYDLNGNQKDGLTLIGVGDDVKVANTTRFASGNSVGAITKAVTLENVTITNTVYTMENGSNATFTKVNFDAGFRQGYGKNVVFTDCTFGSNSEGYALHFQTDSASEGGTIKLEGCEFEGGKVHLGGKRAYEFVGCNFAAGTDFQVWSNITLSGCTVGGVAINADNIDANFPNLNLDKVTIQ